MLSGNIITLIDNTSSFPLVYTSNVFIQTVEAQTFENIIQEYIDYIKENNFINFFLFLLDCNYTEFVSITDNSTYNTPAEYRIHVQKLIYKYTGKLYSQNIIDAICHFECYTKNLTDDYSQLYVTTQSIDIYE